MNGKLLAKLAGTTKAGGQKHELDKFYTKPETALACINKVSGLRDYDLVIEPSAGAGAFSDQIEDCVAYDLDPEHPNIIQKDWFTVEEARDGRRILVIGNPPFGQQNSLAIRFINHAAKFATTIAFILPKSFMKESVQNLLNPNLHLTHSEILPANSFTLHGEDMNVPCVFQIWEYDSTRVREKSAVVQHTGFSFVKKNANPDLYIQRVGGKAGHAGVDWQHRSEQSNYFVKLDEGVVSGDLIEHINSLPFEVRNHSVGPRSLSKKELIKELTDVYSQYLA